MAVKTFTTGEVLTAADTNTYLANSGLVYITTATLSSTATNVANCFSSTYKRYRLVASITGSAASFCTVQFRYGTTTENTTVYNRRGYYNIGAGPVNYSGTGEVNTFFCQYGTTHAGFTVCDINNPFEAARTTLFVHNMDGAVYDEYSTVCTVATTTSYDGIRFNAFSGNLAGEVQIYGYRTA